MKHHTNRFFCSLFLFICIAHFGYGQMDGQSTLQRTMMRDLKWNMALKRAGDVRPVYLFNENYLEADLVAPTGKLITRQKFRLNLQESKLYYLDSVQTEMEVVNPVKKITFIEQEGNNAVVNFEKGFPPVDNLNADNYYQVLVPGKASLLLDTKFIDVDRIEYPSGVPIKRTDKLVNYYGSAGLSTVKLVKTENIVELLADKSKEISTYIQKENIKIKKQSDLVKVFTYYNSLFQ
ncbi:MAG: hypothetical protein V4539_14890 [Bacteroidota bacterium]